MGITAAAAIGGYAATGTAIAGVTVTASMVTWVGVGLTVVGALTKNENLIKIGAGLGLGSQASEIYKSLSSAATEKTAESTAGQLARGVEPQTAVEVARDTGMSSTAETLANSASPGLADSAEGLIANEAASTAAPAVSQAVEPLAQNTSKGILEAAGLGKATPLSSVAPGTSSLSADASAFTFGGVPVKPAVGEPMGWGAKMTAWFDGLKPEGKLAVGQTAAGVVSGVGKAAGQYMDTSRRMDWEREQQARRARNLAGVPSLWKNRSA